MESIVWYLDLNFGSHFEDHRALSILSVQGPLIEGRLFGLNYEAVLSGPMVIPFKKIVEIHSGTSSLQGELHRHILLEVAAYAETRTRCSHIHYGLEESSFKIQGPATALQDLQV
jgi:hypothetical protein